ncbi:MAG: hypothetical protein HY748_14035 [Elusimicrobia bacterium]|nr:hypothetical protein [Elusimicrobiota bacterium]
MLRHTAVTVTKDALVVRIPWAEVAHVLQAGGRRARVCAAEVLEFVREGRAAHRKGRARLVSSLSDLT